MIITIDGGTTNTRVYLWKNRETLLASEKSEVGARNTIIDGNNKRLGHAVHALIDNVLVKADISINSVDAIYASGMITSEIGLYELGHIIAPKSVQEFSDAVKPMLLPNVCSKEICFIPGLKNFPDSNVTLNNVLDMDVMRGEETEAIGLLSEVPETDAILVLPGTHTKFIVVKDEKIIGCLTSMSGELLQLITQESIIAEAVNKQFVSGVPEWEYFIKGAHNVALTHSFNRVVFSTRILSKFVSNDQNKCASYLLGVVLENDLDAIKYWTLTRNIRNAKVIISGKEPLSSALKFLFDADKTFSDVRIYHPVNELPLSGIGAWKIHDYRCLSRT